VQLHQLPCVILIETFGTPQDSSRSLEFFFTHGALPAGTSVASSPGPGTPVEAIAQLGDPLFHDLGRSRTDPIIQVKKHGGTLGRRHQEIFEASKNPRADHIVLKAGGVHPIQTLGHEDVEVVHPEVDHQFLKLAFTVDGSNQPSLGKLLSNLAGAGLDFLDHGLRISGVHGFR